MADLARVVDPAALEGAVAGRFALDVLAEWLDERATIAFVVPKRVTCARCDGGGCDACDRSGAFRIEGDDHARTLQLTLPAEPSLVRIAFTGPPEVLLVELRPAAAPTAQVIPRRRRRWWLVIALVVIAAMIAYSSCHAPFV